MSAKKSFGTQKFRKNIVPKKVLYKGEMHKVIRHDASNGVYVLQSKTDPKKEIEVPTTDYLSK